MKKIIIYLMIILILPITANALEIDKDINSGIILSSEENIVPSDTVLSVKSVNNNNIDSLAKTFGLTRYTSYNIALLDKATRIVPNGEVTLSFPIPNTYNLNIPKQIFILKLGANSIDTVYATEQDTMGLYDDLIIEDGYAVINTSSFSLDSDTTYIIGTTVPITTSNTNRIGNQTTTTQVDNPNTLDNNFSVLLIISISAIGGIMLLITKLYLDNKN